MPNEFVEIRDTVAVLGEGKEYTVVQTRHTVGIVSPEDELLLQDVNDGTAARWEKRKKLFLIRKPQREGDGPCFAPARSIY